jgi:hypothetical protein
VVLAALGAAITLVLGVGFVDASSLAQSDERATARLAGPTRFDTAVAISQHQFPEGAPVVYVARADDPADAVAGGSLTRGPVLLVPSCGTVPPTVLDEIDRLGPSEIVALGGPRAICDEVLQQAAGIGNHGAPTPPEGHEPEPDEPVTQPSPADFDVSIAKVVPNPPDGDEYVELRNTGGGTRDVGGWYLLDADSNYLGIPPGYQIPPGGTLRLYSGAGTSTADRYYANRQPMLDDTGDTIELFRSNGELIDRSTY